MPSITDLLRWHLLRDVHLPEPPLDELMRTERSPAFEALCIRRKIMGRLRYGALGAPGKPQYDRVACAIRRLQEYLKDHNAEHLVDAANLCEIEFVEGEHYGVVAVDDGTHTPLSGA